MIKVINNPNKELLKEIVKAVNDNDGYCPCMLVKNPSTKCMCEEFRNNIQAQKLGECHCGRYILVDE